MVEFWQGQMDFVNDRICFRQSCEGEQIDPEMTHKGLNGWVIERLLGP